MSSGLNEVSNEDEEHPSKRPRLEKPQEPNKISTQGAPTVVPIPPGAKPVATFQLVGEDGQPVTAEDIRSGAATSAVITATQDEEPSREELDAFQASQSLLQDEDDDLFSGAFI